MYYLFSIIMKYRNENDEIEELNCLVCKSPHLEIHEEWVELASGGYIPISKCQDCGVQTFLYEEWSNEYEVVD
jgi:hypothetical protein